MFTQPDDLDADDVADALRTAWHVEIDELDYAPVGFGSHHWDVRGGGRRWFANVDDLDLKRRDPGEARASARDRLVGALTAARAARDGGLEFVAAPEPRADGSLIAPIGARYVVALYPFIEGTAGVYGPYPEPGHRLQVVEALARLHDLPVPRALPADDPGIPKRGDLDRSLDGPGRPWGPGPHAEEGRRLVSTHAELLRARLDRYDELVEHTSRSAHVVATHGEPHPGNTIRTESGLMLIDWDTARAAPPERDLWRLVEEDASVASHYEARAGRALDPQLLRRYSQWWDLCEVSLFVDDLRRPHDDVPETRLAIAALTDLVAGAV